MVCPEQNFKDILTDLCIILFLISFSSYPTHLSPRHYLKVATHLRGTISKLYHLIFINLNHCMSQGPMIFDLQSWNRSITPPDLLSLVSYSAKLSIEYTGLRKNVIIFFPSINPECDQCHHRPANLLHMFWNFPISLSSSWNFVFESLSAITHTCHIIASL